jgi:hypothetical protein
MRCNKCEKPTGAPGDPKRDMILRYQLIHLIFLAKSFSVECVDSDRDDGIDLDEDDEEEDKLDIEEVAIDGSRSNSRTSTPTVHLVSDTKGGIAIVATENIVNVPSVPPLAQQSTYDKP